MLTYADVCWRMLQLASSPSCARTMRRLGLPAVLRYSIYSLYWYKSTNTDAKGAARAAAIAAKDLAPQASLHPWSQQWVMESRYLAVAMALHPRLGSKSYL